MRPIIVNTKQKIAVLAAGLAVTSTGFVVADGSGHEQLADARGAQEQEQTAAAAQGPDGAPARFDHAGSARSS